MESSTAQPKSNDKASPPPPTTTTTPTEATNKKGKKEKVKDIELVKEFYGYSTEKAAQALRILSPTQLDVIRSKLNKGGKKR